MINQKSASKFEPKKFQQNIFCRYKSTYDEDEYEQDQKCQINRLSLGEKTNKHQINSTQAIEEQKNQIVDLQDLWDSVEAEKKDSEKGRIKVSIMNEAEEVYEFTAEEFEQMIGQDIAQEVKSQHQIEKSQSEQPEDMGDLWDEIDKQCKFENENISALVKTHSQKNKETETCEIPLQTKKSNQIQGFDLNELLNLKNEKSFNYNISKDYLIYDYQSFVTSCFQTNIHSYFGFYQSSTNKNTYFLYDLMSKQNIMECFMDSYDQSFVKPTNKKVKMDYQIEYCLKFKLSKSNDLMATAFHKYINNGIMYNLKPFNSYENQYEDSLALVEITDGFIGSNCYCNTNVFISQKYTNQPGQLKMIIGMKNGYLIANMGVNGVKSAPYNCRLQNYQSNFVYLLGMIDKQSGHFIVRVGEGMSPLIAFAISVGRKRYIDSFSQ